MAKKKKLQATEIMAILKAKVPAMKEKLSKKKIAKKEEEIVRPATIAENIAMAARSATIELQEDIVKLNYRIDRIVIAHEKCKSLKNL